MSENAIESVNTSKPAPDTAKPKGARKVKKAAKKAGRVKKTTSKPKADRTNKKAGVIAMMKRTKGATLPEIMKATGWRPHTVRGLVSILGSKGGEKNRVFQERRGRTDVQDREITQATHRPNAAFGHAPGRRFLLLAQDQPGVTQWQRGRID